MLTYQVLFLYKCNDPKFLDRQVLNPDQTATTLIKDLKQYLQYSNRALSAIVQVYTLDIEQEYVRFLKLLNILVTGLSYTC